MIDAHQHFWRIGRDDCTWPHAGLEAIHRDFTPPDLLAVAGPLGVQGSVLVQSQPSDRDTDYLMELAAAEPFVRAVVGWVELSAPNASERILKLARRPKFRGLRPMLQALSRDDWVLDPGLEPAVETMIGCGLSLDALVLPRHLPHLLAFAERHPALAIVVDHAAKPDIARGDLAAWRAAIAPLAALPQVCCKLSGLLTECAPDQGIDHVRPYADALLELFGPRRLMWGSDWPVLNLAGDYAGWLAMARDLVRGAGPEAMDEVFARTAQRFYRF